MFARYEAEYLSSKYMTELITDPTTSAVMRLKYLDLMKKRDRQVGEIDLFQDMVFQGNRNLQGVINNGERSFADFIPILDKQLSSKNSWPQRTQKSDFWKHFIPR